MELMDDNGALGEGAKILAQKKAMPTTLKSVDIRKLDPQLVRMANFSAQTTMVDLLDLYKHLLGEIITPPVEQREDRVTAENPQGNVTTGPSVAKARSTISDFLDDMGYKPDAGTEGSILDLSSFGRIMLKLETDMATTFGAGRFVKQNSDPLVVDAYPGLSFERTMVPRGGVDAERNWGERWLAAAKAAGDDQAAAVYRETGEMIALKSSAIWQALGDGAGGYDDTLGNPYDPIAFNTYMRQFEVPRAKMESLGFLTIGEKAKAAPFGLGELFGVEQIKNRVTGRVTISNGDYEGHPFHGNQWSEVSDAAYAKSDAARTPDELTDAANDHRQAAQVRREQAEKDKGDKEWHDLHLESAARHESMAGHLDVRAKNGRDIEKLKAERDHLMTETKKSVRRTNILKSAMREH